jgi:hypothetical protein
VKGHRNHLRWIALAATGWLVAGLAVGACGDGQSSEPAGGDALPFQMTSSPEFVQGVIPGHRPLAIVEILNGEDPVELTASGVLEPSGQSVDVTFLPPSVFPAGAAEVWVEVPEVTDEENLTVTVTGRRGPVEEQLTITTFVVPFTDELEATALDIAEVFLNGLPEGAAPLPADRAGLTGGTTVASRLLVVSHYAWFTDEVEVGLSWHIMVAPDDWAELYVRPRDAARPTVAFRLSSWSTALTGGEFTIETIQPPGEVTR